MAKRYTDSAKWDRRWFRLLTPAQKCFWIYLLDKCDVAGFWIVDIEAAEFFIGTSIDSEFLEPFNKQIDIIRDGKRWFIKDFIKFQYNRLSRNCKPHEPVFRSIDEHGYELIEIDGEVIAQQKSANNPINKEPIPLTKGIDNPSLRVKEKEKEKEKEKVKEKVKEKEKEKEKEIQQIKMDVTPEALLWEKGLEIFGEKYTLTEHRRRVLRDIRTNVSVGPERFLQACQNLARSDFPIKSIIYFTDKPFDAINRVDRWALENSSGNANSKKSKWKKGMQDYLDAHPELRDEYEQGRAKDE